VRQPCATCGGQGAVERTRQVNVAFPAGIDAGQRLRVPGQGMPSSDGAPPGDLYVEVDVEADERFERDGADLVTRVHVAFTDVALGAEVRVPALEPDDPEAALKVTLVAGTQSGAVLTLKGHGIPRLDGRGRGALIVVVQVDVPTALSSRARALLTELGEELKGEAASSSKRAASVK
jgi:molecular chaperone DnaJ